MNDDHVKDNTKDTVKDTVKDNVKEIIKDDVKKYVDILMEANSKINLVSRQITNDGLNQLLNETFLLADYISCDIVIDAGSGNGLLGIPIAIGDKNKRVILVEPKQKKIAFLRDVKVRMNLPNLEIIGTSLEEYLVNFKKKGCSLISRGFPELSPLVHYVKIGTVKEAIIITSENKIKKTAKQLVTVKKKIYNVPLRTHLKILKMEKTERE